MQKESCEGCKFARKPLQDFAGDKIECRRNPPSVFPMQDGRGNVGLLSGWAAHDKFNWCGAFEAKLAIEL